MKIFRRRDKGMDSKYLNRMIIGLGHGLIRTRDFILNKEYGVSTQDAMDSLSIWIGRELMKTMLENGVVNVRDSDERLVNGLMGVINLADELDVEVKNDHIKLVVQKCLICPKRIGGYDLEGNTACPVGGVLTGAISYARGIDPTVTKNRLQTAEICHIEMEYNT
ncbi:MAG: hypothetical protein EAX91_15250 [Candidatus Lokiarchaeota archaeon]|nr:hypothetical protein [Candidatus Lokiarchaeota archaeon]